ncbi:STAS domain-containing protein [Phytohabitans kaempferiae]|uniref:Anti-sigma factor antagonist n=1 Tax=Phytohabitans kaempferiae TaxID=1620943 RepID=A0ABV6LYK6_9ACTN
MDESLSTIRRRYPAADAYGELGLAVEVEERDEITLVRARGVIDFWNVGPLQEQLHDALQVDPARLVLDLRDVSFVDSTGLGLLLSVQDRAASEDGWLRLAGPNPLVRRLLRATELDRRLPVYPTVAAAAAA